MSLNAFGFSAAQCRVMDEILATHGLGVVSVRDERQAFSSRRPRWCHFMTLEDGREVALTTEQEATWISEPSEVR